MSKKRTDTERLDWLLDRGLEVQSWQSGSGLWYNEVSTSGCGCCSDSRRIYESKEEQDLRTVIDRAMEIEDESGKAIV